MFWKKLLCSLAILVLGAYYACSIPEVFPAVADVLADPDGHRGEEIVASYVTVSRPGKEGFWILCEKHGTFLKMRRNLMEVFVSGRCEGLRPGVKVSLILRLGRDGGFVMEDCFVHRDFAWKKYASLAAVLFVGVLFVRSYRFDFRRFLFTERRRA
jgi:hypothetical protein